MAENESKNYLAELMKAAEPKEISRTDWENMVRFFTQLQKDLASGRVALTPSAEDDVPEGIRRLPAHYVNTWYYNWGPEGLRLTFGEDLGERTEYRTAVYLTPKAIRELVDGLTEILINIGQSQARVPPQENSEHGE